MKASVESDEVTLVLTPENEEEKALLKSWWANATFGRIDVQYRFFNPKTGAIGIRVYKQEQTMLRVVITKTNNNL